MNKLILIDGSNLLHRSLHIPDVFQLSYNGIKTGGVHSFIRSLMMIVKGFGDFPVVFWDRGFSERRIKLYPNYKKREDKNSELKAGQVEPKDLEYLDEYRKQRAIICRILDGLCIPSLLLDNTEADDMIYFFSTKFKDHVSCIMSEDLDYLQLLDSVDLFLPMRKKYYSLKKDLSPGLANYLTLNRVVLQSLSDLEFEDTKHYLIAKAMKGDPSDNIKGAKGIGDVSARKLASEYVKNPNYLQSLKEKTKLSAFEKKLLLDWDSFTLALELIDLSKEQFDSKKIEEIMLHTTMALSKDDPDLISLMGVFGEYGLQQIIGDLQEYLKVLMYAKYDIKKVLVETK